MFISNTSYFNQDHRALNVEMIEGILPTVYVTAIANAKMQHYVDFVSDEVGWLGTVEELESGDYLIEDVFLFDQRVSGSTTEISEDSLAQFAEEMLQRDDGMELMNKLRFWGHSHVNMGTNPSGQDNSQMDTFADSGHDFFLRGIYNKKGEVNLSVYHYSRGIILHHVEWQLYVEEEEELRESIKEEIKSKVKRITYPKHSYYGNRYPKTPYNNTSWQMPNQRGHYWEHEDDLEDDDDAYFNGHKSIPDSIGDNIDDVPEVTQDEYEELTKEFHQEIARQDVNSGRIPDDPQGYKYRGTKT